MLRHVCTTTARPASATLKNTTARALKTNFPVKLKKIRQGVLLTGIKEVDQSGLDQALLSPFRGEEDPGQSSPEIK
jgi:hypothetical protein